MVPGRLSFKKKGMTPQLSLCVLRHYLLLLLCRRWAPAERRAQPPRGTRLLEHILTNVIPGCGPRIHHHNHSMLELEGEGGSAKGHLNLIILFSIPTQRLEEFGGLMQEKRQRKGL